MTAALRRLIAAGLIAAALGAAAAAPAHAQRQATTAASSVSEARLGEIQAALDEQRYLDAGRMIDQAMISGAKDPRLILMGGELNLVRGRHDDALKAFNMVSQEPSVQARASQGKGIVLSILGRSDDALSTLQQAVALDPKAWRAWNALGGEFDRRRDWKNAEAAYELALSNSGGAAIVLNNRGFSRMLQNRLDEATTDLVAALQKKPDLAAARTNLRLTMGLKGDYERALAGGAQEDKAALLNNVGYAAMLRGDHAQAQDMFNRAITAKGQFYDRASDNLEMATGLRTRTEPPSDTLNAGR